MVVNKRKSFSQNFIAKTHLAALLIKQSSINSRDIIYEIGPGSGKLTKELGKRAKKVIAIEKDPVLYEKLRRKFKLRRTITLYNNDFLKFKIRNSDYKIFANIPFCITSAIIKKIVYNENPPLEAYLIIQKEAAEKFVGIGKTTQFSVLIKPWFRLKIIRFFKKIDFSPVPKVDIVMLHIEKRIPPLIPLVEMRLYERFVKQGFNARKKNLKLNYKNIFTYQQWKRLTRNLAFSLRARPSELRFGQWLGLYESYKRIFM